MQIYNSNLFKTALITFLLIAFTAFFSITTKADDHIQKLKAEKQIQLKKQKLLKQNELDDAQRIIRKKKLKSLHSLRPQSLEETGLYASRKTNRQPASMLSGARSQMVANKLSRVSPEKYLNNQTQQPQVAATKSNVKTAVIGLCQKPTGQLTAGTTSEPNLLGSNYNDCIDSSAMRTPLESWSANNRGVGLVVGF